MIFRIFYSYYRKNPHGGNGMWVETSKIVDADSGEELQNEVDLIKQDDCCGYKINYSIGNIVRLDK